MNNTIHGEVSCHNTVVLLFWSYLNLKHWEKISKHKIFPSGIFTKFQIDSVHVSHAFWLMRWKNWRILLKFRDIYCTFWTRCLFIGLKTFNAHYGNLLNASHVLWLISSKLAGSLLLVGLKNQSWFIATWYWFIKHLLIPPFSTCFPSERGMTPKI